MAYDDDIYSALVGGAPTDPQRQAMLARQLRDQATQGRILQASGDRVIGPMGQQMEQQAMTGATGIAGEREREANLRMMQEYRIAQEQNMVQSIAAKLQMQGMKDVTAERVAAERVAGTLGAANIHAQGQGMKLAEGERKEISQMADSVESLRGIINDFKPQYAGVGTGMKNWMAQYGMGPKDWQEAQDWWARYNREFSLQEVHRLFGARFTGFEQQRFEAGHVNPNMNADQITQKLQSIEPHLVNMIRGRIYDYGSGADLADRKFLGAVQNRLGITDESQQVPTPTGRAPHGAASSFPSGAQPAPYPTNAPPMPTAPTGASVPPALRFLQSGPAYQMSPGAVPPGPAGPQSLAPTPFVRPTPPTAPGGMNLFQGIGGIPGG